MAHKRGYTDGINDGTLKGLQHQGIATLHGQAHFQNDGQLAVGDQVVSTTDYVIATGQRQQFCRLPDKNISRLVRTF